MTGGSVQSPGLLASIYYNTETLPVSASLRPNMVTVVPSLAYAETSNSSTGIMALANSPQYFAVQFVGAAACALAHLWSYCPAGFTVHPERFAWMTVCCMSVLRGQHVLVLGAV